MNNYTIEKEVKNLKLNVTNIRSVLISSNKKLKKLQYKKSSTINREEKKIRRLEAEKKKEKVPVKTPIIGGMIKKIRGAASNWMSRITNFFSFLLYGFLINKLPEIIQKIKGIIDKIRPIWEGVAKVFSIISKGMVGLFNVVSGGINGVKNIGSQLKSHFNVLKMLDRDINVSGTDLKTPQSGESDPSPTVSASDPLEVQPDIPIEKFHDGGEVTRTGLAELEAGETVLTKEASRDFEEQFGIPPTELNQSTLSLESSPPKEGKGRFNAPNLPSLGSLVNSMRRVKKNTIANMPMDSSSIQTYILPIEMSSPAMPVMSGSSVVNPPEPRVYRGA